MDMYKRFKNPEGAFKERHPKIICLRNFNNLLAWKRIIRASRNLSVPFPIFFPKKTIASIPSGANKQKIKRIDHNKCNVRTSKNAEQAFSTQRYLYICYGLFFLFSSVFSNELNSNLNYCSFFYPVIE